MDKRSADRGIGPDARDQVIPGCESVLRHDRGQTLTKQIALVRGYDDPRELFQQRGDGYRGFEIVVDF